MKEFIATTLIAAYLLTLAARWLHPALFTGNESLLLLIAATAAVLTASLSRQSNQV